MSFSPWKTTQRRTSLVIVARQISRWNVYTCLATADRMPLIPAYRDGR